LDPVAGNLPAETSSFVGRHSQVEEFVRQMRTHRLVTLTGEGGVRPVGLQVANVLGPEFPEGVWLVELGPLGDPPAVPDAMAADPGIMPRDGMPVADTIAQVLTGRRLLIVLTSHTREPRLKADTGSPK
jgi:predicted ATPase